MTNKKIYIKDIKENQQVNCQFLIKDMRMAETKAGKPYLTLQLIDKSGEMSGRIWDNAEHFEPFAQPGTVVNIFAQSQSYQGVLQLKISNLEKVGSELIDISQFLPRTENDISDMAGELVEIIKSIEDKQIKELLMSFVNDKKKWQLFKQAPAAKIMHHAYIGGLLEHTLTVCRLADMTVKIYPSLNRSLLLAGAVLHDIGKIEEYTYEVPPFNYSDQGRLIGHMVIGNEMIQEKIGELENFPAETSMLIKHIILSHHGRYEFGSPTLPMTREAFALNFIDDLDAKMNYMDRLGSNIDESEYQWTDYQRNLERFLFVTGNSAQLSDDNKIEKSTPEESDKDDPQQSLF